jgi:hypothetical protein
MSTDLRRASVSPVSLVLPASLAALAALAALACAPEERPPPPGTRDAGIERPDGGPIVVRRDAGRDAEAGDSGGGWSDSGVPQPDGAAGPALPVIDGVIGRDEWVGAALYVSTTPAVAPFEGDTLRRLHVLRTSDHLLLAIEGTLEPTHAFLVYVDADVGSERGVILSGKSLGDRSGALDRALSAVLFGRSELRPDYAWGTTVVPRATTASDDRIGWRDLANPTEFRTITGSTNVSACSVSACETAIAIGRGGIEMAGDIAIFVRLGDAEANLSNQTLPQDDPASPESVSVFARAAAR